MKDKLRAYLPGAKGTLWGSLIALPAALVFALLFAALLTAGVPKGFIPLFAHTVVLFAATAGGFTAGWKEKSNGLVSGLCTGLVLFLLHLAVTLCFGSPSLSLLSFGLAEGLGGTLGGIMGVNLRKT